MVARRFDETLERELVALHDAGMTQVALAERYGTTLSTIRASLRRAGVKTRGQGANRRSLTAEECEEIERLYRDGLSQGKIATRLGTSQSKVSTALLKRGVRSSRGAKNGQLHPLWKGGRLRTAYGYVIVKADADDPLARAMANDNFYVMEHRLVMARHLGRPLTRAETVHHINGVRDDNRLENLQLRTGRHGHGIVHRCRACGSTDIEEVTI